MVTTELGGGGEGVSASVHRIAQQGLENVLKHVGVLRGQAQTRAGIGIAANR